jgi:hypothetical protein
MLLAARVIEVKRGRRRIVAEATALPGEHHRKRHSKSSRLAFGVWQQSGQWHSSLG